MNSVTKKYFSIGLLLSVLFLLIFIPNSVNKEVALPEKEEGPISERIENKKARDDYFFQMTRDPKTNSIPVAARAREIAYSKKMKRSLKASSKLNDLFDWQEAGPNVVGGRVRAFALDVSDASGNTMLAGGVTGGVWKSTNGGNAWTQTSDPNENLSITSIAQDPTDTDVWYYAAGEFRGSEGKNAPTYFGTGIWKSTDGGDSWTNLTSNQPGVGDSGWNSAYDFISKIRVSPTSGNIFAATNGFGLYKSTNGQSFNNILGSASNHRYIDFDIDSQGNIIMVASENSAGGSVTPGVFYSTNDGVSWSNITPSTFPSTHDRSVVDFAPSNENFAYIFTNTGNTKTSPFDSESNVEVLSLHKVNVSTGTSSDLSANIPEFDDFRETVVTQSNYNMTIGVSPNDEDFVVLGGVSLYRSTSGFSSAPSSSDKIGGYSSDNHHPDNHNLFFDPQSPNKLWSMHDGGISVTDNAKNSTVVWSSKDKGFNVTQFYTVAISKTAGDTRVIGGTQDNGSPYFRLNDANEKENDISSGDGSFAYIGQNYMYVSSQEGKLLRVGYYQDTGEPLNPFGNDFGEDDWSYIYPNQATSTRFIHPFEVNPNNENVIAYPDAGDLWITTQAESFANFDQDGFETGWTKTTIPALSNHSITALAYSQSNPSNRLYVGASANNLTPRVLRFDNGATNPIEVNIQGVASGAQVNDIAVNPLNGNEVLVILSNYNVKGIYHTTNAGVTWSSIEGNLEGSENDLGPSIRSAEIVEGTTSKVYVVGTSTGVYSTTSLSGDATLWTQEAPSIIGSSIAEHMDYRSSDFTLAVGTHGRGIFIGNAGMAVSNEENLVSNLPEKFNLDQNYPNPFNPSTTISYSLPASSNVSISVYDINGRKVADLINNKNQSAGNHDIRFNATNLASGVYLYKINAKSVSQNRSFSQIKRMTLIK